MDIRESIASIAGWLTVLGLALFALSPSVPVFVGLVLSPFLLWWIAAPSVLGTLLIGLLAFLTS
ncbi:MAG: hypothetical protein AB1830_07740 [Pseudomonadota bacterium]